MMQNRMRDRAVNGFLRRAVEAICEGNFEEAGYLYSEARKLNQYDSLSIRNGIRSGIT